MEQTSARAHARNLLDVASPSTAGVELLNSLVQTAIRDRTTGRAFRNVEQWMLDQLELLGVQPEEALSDDSVLDLLAAIHVVTIHLPRRVRRRPPASFGLHIAAVLDELEPDFVPELLKETRRRIADDPSFAREMADSRGTILELRDRSDAIRAEVVGPIPEQIASDTDQPLIVQTAAVGVFPIIAFAFIIIGGFIIWNERKDDDD